MLYIPVNNFLVMFETLSRIEPVLSRSTSVKPMTPQSQVSHSTTEPLPSSNFFFIKDCDFMSAHVIIWLCFYLVQHNKLILTF